MGAKLRTPPGGPLCPRWSSMGERSSVQEEAWQKRVRNAPRKAGGHLSGEGVSGWTGPRTKLCCHTPLGARDGGTECSWEVPYKGGGLPFTGGETEAQARERWPGSGRPRAELAPGSRLSVTQPVCTPPLCGQDSAAVRQGLAAAQGLLARARSQGRSPCWAVISSASGISSAWASPVHSLANGL